MVDELVNLAENLQDDARRLLVDSLILAAALVLARRFRQQRARVAEALDEMYSGLAAGEVATAAQIANVTQVIQHVKNATFTAKLNQIIDTARTRGAQLAKNSLGVNPTTTLGPSPRRALDVFADVDRTTGGRVTSIIKSGFEAGDTRAQVRQAVRAQFGDWQQTIEGARASTIGLNEVSSSFHGGMLALAKATGSNVRKTWWVDVNPCEDCEGNTGESVLIGEPFASGSLAPPEHLNCRCSLTLSQAE